MSAGYRNCSGLLTENSVLPSKCDLDPQTKNDQILKRFWKGINTEIRKLILSQTPSDLSSAVKMAKDAEKFLEEQRETKQINASFEKKYSHEPRKSISDIRNRNYRSPNRTSGSRSPVSSSYSPSSDSRRYHGTTGRRLTPSDYNRKPLIVCYGCGRNGHIARDCQQQKNSNDIKVCFKCNMSGHIARNCQKKQ